MPLDEVLYLIRNSYGKPFRIVFIRSTGSAAGSKKIVMRAIYGAKTSRMGNRRKSRKGMSSWLHKDYDTIPLIDLDSDKPITPLISHIIEFNNKLVNH